MNVRCNMFFLKHTDQGVNTKNREIQDVSRSNNCICFFIVYNTFYDIIMEYSF